MAMACRLRVAVLSWRHGKPDEAHRHSTSLLRRVGGNRPHGAARGAAPTYLQGPSEPSTVPSRQPDSILTLSGATADAVACNSALARFAATRIRFAHFYATNGKSPDGQNSRHRGSASFLIGKFYASHLDSNPAVARSPPNRGLGSSDPATIRGAQRGGFGALSRARISLGFRHCSHKRTGTASADGGVFCRIFSSDLGF